MVEIFAVIFSLLSVWLTAKNKIWCWPTGIIGILGFSYLFYMTSEWSNLGLQAIFLIQSFIGWFNWSKSNLINPSFLSKENLNRLKIFFIITAIISYSISFRLNSSNPILDSLTTTLSISAMILLMYKKIESWYFWIFADILYIILFMKNSLYLSAFVYLIFTFNALYGLRNWNEILNKQKK